MKRVLPPTAKISKEAKETVQECVSEFISFITGEASDKCHREKRKTVNGDDLIWAMSTLGFDDYIEPLKLYLQRYRETEGEKAQLAKGGEGSDAGARAAGDDGRGPAGAGAGGTPPASSQGAGQYGASPYGQYGLPPGMVYAPSQMMVSGGYQAMPHSQSATPPGSGAS
eukprot:SM000007S20908  [mRNA]  locus=s7:887528:888492:- [translate_table: standard]